MTRERILVGIERARATLAADFAFCHAMARSSRTEDGWMRKAVRLHDDIRALDHARAIVEHHDWPARALRALVVAPAARATVRVSELLDDVADRLVLLARRGRP